MGEIEDRGQRPKVVQRVKSLELAASGIMKLNDVALEEMALDNLRISKAEWVQAITEALAVADGEWMRMYAAINDGEIAGYMLVTNCWNPPMSRFFMVNYLTLCDVPKAERIDVGKEMMEMAKEWAERYGCRRFISMVKNDVMARFYCMHGFELTPGVMIKHEWA